MGICLVCLKKSLRPAGTEGAKSEVGSVNRGREWWAGSYRAEWASERVLEKLIVYAPANMPMAEHGCLSPWVFMTFQHK